MKYRVKALKHGEYDWQPAYVEPAGGNYGGAVLTGNQITLSPRFKTRDEAILYAKNILKGSGLSDENIEEVEPRE